MSVVGAYGLLVFACVALTAWRLRQAWRRKNVMDCKETDLTNTNERAK